jgi:hypothetical protein
MLTKVLSKIVVSIAVAGAVVSGAGLGSVGAAFGRPSSTPQWSTAQQVQRSDQQNLRQDDGNCEPSGSDVQDFGCAVSHLPGTIQRWVDQWHATNG